MMLILVLVVIIIFTHPSAEKTKIKNAVIGVWGEQEIRAWEYNYFNALALEGWTTSNPKLKINNNYLREKTQNMLTRYLVGTQKALEAGIQLSAEEINAINGLISDNELKLDSNSPFVTWSEAVFHSVTRDQIFEIESNNEKIKKLLDQMSEQDMIDPSQLKLLYEQQKENYKIDQRYKVEKIVIREQSEVEQPSVVLEAYHAAISGADFESLVLKCSTEQPVIDSKGDDYIMEGASDTVA